MQRHKGDWGRGCARDWVRRYGELAFNSDRVSALQDERAMEMDDGEDCTTSLMPLKKWLKWQILCYILPEKKLKEIHFI